MWAKRPMDRFPNASRWTGRLGDHKWPRAYLGREMAFEGAQHGRRPVSAMSIRSWQPQNSISLRKAVQRLRHFGKSNINRIDAATRIVPSTKRTMGGGLTSRPLDISGEDLAAGPGSKSRENLAASQSRHESFHLLKDE